MKTIVGLYDDWTTARRVLEELVQAGFDRNHINLIANDRDQTYANSLQGDTGSGEKVAEGVATGALAGGALGGLGGLLLGLGALAIPGIGPVIAAGPIAAGLTGAAVGAATGGLVGALAGWGIPEEEAGYYAEGVRRGGTLVGVEAEDHQVDRALAIMNRYGPVDIERRAGEWRASGWSGFDANAGNYKADTNGSMASRMKADMGPTTRNTNLTEGEAVIPIVEEELRVGKREVETGGVRIHTYVEENPVSEEVKLRQERVNVERRPVDRAVDPSTVDAFREQTFEMTERAEQVVAEKTARVVEEVVVGKEVENRTENVSDTVRRTRVDVENTNGGATGMTNWDEFDTRWRSHYNQFYGGSGRNYEYYQPGYRYGYTLANDQRYAGRGWALVEPDVRRDWEATGQGAWEDFKDAIRQGWNEVREAVR
jgi:uncharacterized protein (TIGR02271 family)